MKLLQQAPQQQGPGAGGSGWSGSSSSGLGKAGKPTALTLLEMQQEAERLLKQQQQQRSQLQRDRVSLNKFLRFHTRRDHSVGRADSKAYGHYNLPNFSLFAALWHVDGELLHGRAVGGWCWYVGWAWRHGG